jgi:hypothetical protein
VDESCGAGVPLSKYKSSDIYFQLKESYFICSKVSLVQMRPLPLSSIGAGSFPGLKRPIGDVNHPPIFSAEVKARWSYPCTPPLCLHDMLEGDLYLVLMLTH